MDHNVLPFIPERATTVTEGLETPGRGRKERMKSFGIRGYVHAAFGLCASVLALAPRVAQDSHIHTA